MENLELVQETLTGNADLDAALAVETDKFNELLLKQDGDDIGADGLVEEVEEVKAGEATVH